MKIEEKHIFGYLPHGVMSRDSSNTIYRDVLTIDNYTHFIGNYADKMILRPLSSLTKVELALAGFDSHIDYLTHENKGVEWTLKAPYNMVNYLFKNHYDVFELIENGLAVDITTLKS